MSTQNRVISRAAIVAAATLLLAAGANAQGAQADARWQAWIGCWKASASDPTTREFGSGGSVCVTPTAAPLGVDVSTIVAGKVVDRATLTADASKHPIEKDGCAGTQSVRFSSLGSRVYVSSELLCPGGVVRKSSGIMSFTQNGEWLDVQGVSGKNAQGGVFVARYDATSDLSGIPPEVASAVPARGPVSTSARIAAMAPMSLGDIADASVASEAGVVQAWLVERTRGLTLNISGAQLKTLADQGVAPQVIDVIVALAYPRTFALNPGSREAEFRPADNSNNRQRSNRLYAMPFGYGYLPYDYYDCGYGYYGYGYGLSRYGCYSAYYGYRGYGYGYYPAYGYGGYYPGTTVVVVERPQETPRPHGRVVKGEGYTSGTTSTPSGGRTSSSSGGSSSGSSGGSSGTSSGSSSSGGGDRTAHKKP